MSETLSENDQSQQRAIIVELQGMLQRAWVRLEDERAGRAQDAVALTVAVELERKLRAQVDLWRGRAALLLAAGAIAGAGLGFAWGLLR